MWFRRSNRIIAGLALLALANVALPFRGSAAEKNGGGEVLATVDGREIRQSDLDRAEASFGDALKQLPAVGTEAPKLERYINFRLVAEAARDAGLSEDPEVRRTIEQMTDLILYRTFLVHFVDEVTSESALRERYDLKYAGGKGLQQVHAFHIRVDTREAAESVIDALKGGADFGYLAEEHSVAPSAKDGGDIGFVGPGDLSPAFIEAAFALEPGEYTEQPVQTPSGWEVIKVDARRMQKAPSFADAKAKLANESVEKALHALLVKLREREGLETAPEPASK